MSAESSTRQANPLGLQLGEHIHVKVNGELTPAIYRGWSEKYWMPLVEVSGKILPRKVFKDAAPMPPAAPIEPAPKAEAGTAPPFPDTVGVRVEWRRDHYEIFNWRGKLIQTLTPTNAGHAHDKTVS